MGTTSPDALPYPDDYSDPADTPAAFEALALAAQAALKTRSGTGHTHDGAYPPQARQIIAGAGLTGGGSLAADRTLNVGAGTGITVAADTVALDTGYTDGRYAAASHGHVPSQVGIRTARMVCTSIAAGAEWWGDAWKAADEHVWITIDHPSSYIVGHVEEYAANAVRVEIRNTTTGTTHTNVAINLLFVRSA